MTPLSPRPEPDKVSERLDRWVEGDSDKTLGSLLEVFEEKSFAIAFVLLLGVSALPLPTGGATHVFEKLSRQFKQLTAGGIRVGLSHQHQRHRIARVGQILQHPQRPPRVAHTLDSVVAGVALNELSLDVVEDDLVFVHDEKDGHSVD